MRKFTEFEVQAEAYFKLVDCYGLARVFGEYRVKREGETRGARIDLVVMAEDLTTPMIAIEMKRARKSKPRKATSGLNQKERYEDLLNCPCIVLRGMDEALKVVQAVRAALSVSVDVGGDKEGGCN